MFNVFNRILGRFSPKEKPVTPLTPPEIRCRPEIVPHSRFIGQQARLTFVDNSEVRRIQGEVSSIDISSVDGKDVLTLTFKWVANRTIRDDDSTPSAWTSESCLVYQVPLTSYKREHSGAEYHALSTKNPSMPEILFIKSTAKVAWLDPSSVSDLGIAE